MSNRLGFLYIRPVQLLWMTANRPSRLATAARQRAFNSQPASQGALLVLVINFAVDSGQWSALHSILFKLLRIPSCCIRWLVGLPYRVIRISFRCMWLGLGHAPSIPLTTPPTQPTTCMLYAVQPFLFPVAFVIINSGLAGFQANALQFGTDIDLL